MEKERSFCETPALPHPPGFRKPRLPIGPYSPEFLAHQFRQVGPSLLEGIRPKYSDPGIRRIVLGQIAEQERLTDQLRDVPNL